MSTAAGPSSSSPPQARSSTPEAAPVAVRSHSSKATAALVLGILGVVLALLIPIGGVVLGILAIVFGNQARGEGIRPGQAKAGLVLGVVALVLAVANVIATVIIAT